MKICGIICEYNPFHNGHKKQFSLIRQALGEDTAIVCLMSGNFVQRGAPAIFDKSLRANAALQSGADLVLELPVTYALSSAEGFAAGGISILSRLCTHISFGCESGTEESLFRTAQALLSPAFSSALREQLDTGISFAKARQEALGALGCDARLLSSPNDILGTEYCKAILAQKSPLSVLPLVRKGSYHAIEADTENPSATSLRRLLIQGTSVSPFVPTETQGSLHDLAWGERAILGKLRTMTDSEFEALPFGSEGLWRKLMHNARSLPTLEEILEGTKSKRYTRTRLDRMVMCAFLGITRTMLEDAAYVRVLAMNDRGRALLKAQKSTGFFCNPGEKREGIAAELEERCGRLYGLFSEDTIDPPNMESHRRLIYVKM